MQKIPFLPCASYRWSLRGVKYGGQKRPLSNQLSLASKRPVFSRNGRRFARPSHLGTLLLPASPSAARPAVSCLDISIYERGKIKEGKLPHCRNHFPFFLGFTPS